MRRRRHEIGAVGFDDFLQLGGSDPEPGVDVNFGLRIPAFPAPGGYLFLCACVDLLVGEIITGVRQYLEIAAAETTTEDGPPLYVFPFRVQTPGWRPPDAFVEWILTLQNISGQPLITGPLDRQSFVFQDSQQPALLYQTAHFPALPTSPGYLGLDGYTRPSLLGTRELVLRSIQFPWDDPTSLTALNRPVTSSTRVRLYAFVRQTDPDTRTLQPAVTDPGALCPEDRFVSAFPTYQYWRVAGEIIVERAKRQQDTEPSR